MDTPQPKFLIDKRAAKVAAEVVASGDPDELLSDADLAELAGLSVQFFQIARVKGTGPAFIRLSPRRIRTRRGDFVEWLRQRTYLRTNEYQAAPTGRKPGSRVVDGRVVPPEAA